MKYTILTTATLLFMVGCSTTKCSETPNTPMREVDVSQYENEFNYDSSQYKYHKVWPDFRKIFRLEREKKHYMVKCTRTPEYARKDRRWHDPNFRKRFEEYLHNECVSGWIEKERFMEEQY